MASLDDYIRQRRGVDDYPDEGDSGLTGISSIDDLRGTVFDDSDPISNWRKMRTPTGPTLGLGGRIMEKVGQGAAAVTQALDYPLLGKPLDWLKEKSLGWSDQVGDVDPTGGGNPELARITPSKQSLRSLAAYPAAVAETTKPLTSPLGVASFFTGTGPAGMAGSVARGALGAEQMTGGLGDIYTGYKNDDWRGMGTGALETALGATLAHGTFGDLAGESPRVKPPDWQPQSEPIRRGKLTRLNEDPQEWRPLRGLLSPAKLDEASFGDGGPGGPGPGQIGDGGPGGPIDADYEDLTKLLQGGTGRNPSFYGNDAGELTRTMDAGRRPPRGLLTDRAGVNEPWGLPAADHYAPENSNRALTPQEYLDRSKLNGGDPLADLEATLGSSPSSDPFSQQALPIDQWMETRKRATLDQGNDVQQPPPDVGAAPVQPTGPAGPKPLSPAAGQLPEGAPGELPAPDAGGLAEGGSDGQGAADSGMVFQRRSPEENAQRLTPEVRRELQHMLDEFSVFPYYGKTFIEGGRGQGGDFDSIRAGGAGTPIYDEIQGNSLLNRSNKAGDGIAGKVRGDRGDVAAAIQRVLETGDIHNNLADGAVTTAEKWLQADARGEKAGGWLPRGPFAGELPAEMPDELSNLIDEWSAKPDGLSELEQTIQPEPAAGSFEETLANFGGNGHPESPDYVGKVLGKAGPGQPGLSIEPLTGTNVADLNTQHVVYRGADGQPIAVAKVAQDMNGKNLVMDLAADKSKGLLTGRAMKALADQLEKMGATEAAGTMSPDAVNFLDRMKAKRATPAPVDDVDALLKQLEGRTDLPPDKTNISDLEQVIGDTNVNASGESAASAEALSRQAGMKARGETFAVVDRAGNVHPLLGPDAVDYQVKPGETWGTLSDVNGFTPLEGEGRMPRADVLDTGEIQNRLPEAGGVRDANVPTPEFDMPFSLTAPENRSLDAAPRGLDFNAEPDAPTAPDGLSELESLVDIKPRHEVRNPAKVAEIGESMQRVGYQGRPILVINDNGARTAWSGTHRLAAAQEAGLKPSDVPMVEVDADRLRAAGYDVNELHGMKKKARIKALREAGEEQAANLLEEERGAAQQRRANNPAPDVPEGVPSNVRDYLTRQLGYTPEQVDGMGAAEARDIGRNQIRNPDAVAAGRPPEPQGPPAMREPSQLPNFDQFDESRRARGLQRRERVQRTAVAPSEPGAVEGAPLPKTPAERKAAGETLTAGERAQLGLPEEKVTKGRPSLREQGVSPRQIEQRVRKLDAWMEDPTPENFAKWAREVSGQAERVNDRAFRGGTGEGLPPKSPSGETLYSGFDPSLLMNPRIQKSIRDFFLSNDTGNLWARRLVGAGVGAALDPDNRLQGAMAGFLAATYGPEMAKLIARDASKTFSEGWGWWEKEHGALVQPYDRTPRTEDIGVIERALGSKAHTIPEQFQNVRPGVEAFQRVKETGKIDSRLPLLDERMTGDPGAKVYKGGKLQVRQSEFLKPEIDYLREQATSAKDGGRPRLGSYLNAYADELAGTMTRSEQLLKDAGIRPRAGGRASSEIANQVYRSGLAFNPGSAVVNRISQPLLATPYVGKNLWKAYGPLKPSERGLSKITRPVDISDVDKPAMKALDKFDELASSMMRVTDNQNRQGVYAAAFKTASESGASPAEAHTFARDVSEKTQGLLGLMSGNPSWRGPVIKTLKPFTKYPILFTEWLNDVALAKDPRVRWRSLAMAGGVLAFSKATGVDVWDMLAGGARYGGSTILRAAMDVYAHATNQVKDHTLLDTSSPAAFADSDVGNIAYPVGVRKTVDTAKRFYRYGTDVHKKRTPGGALEEVSPLEDAANLVGIRTTRQTERQQVLNDAHAAETRAAAEDAQTSAQAKREFYDALDSGDAEGVQAALAKLGPNTRKSVLKGANRDRFERLLHTTPKKRRPQLQDKYGELARELQLE